MKKTLKFFLLGLLLVSCASKNKVIEYPLVGASNTTMLVFEKVELTDTATVLTVRGFYTPEHWIKVSPNIHLVTQDKEYELIGSNGVELGKELFMPEDGDSCFTLFFEFSLKLSFESFVIMNLSEISHKSVIRRRNST